jgi:GNAT superfamily N-acetyltransferase
MLEVRPAAAADADTIGRIHVETWRAAYGDLLPGEAFDLAERQRWWREVLARNPRPGSAILVAEDGGEIVGFASVGGARDELAGVGELYTIYVHPSCWSTGAGRALISHAEASMRAFGFREAILWVLDGNERAERFYRAAGWTRDGRKVDDFQGVQIAEARYRKAL